MPSHDGGLGSALVGEKIVINQRQVAVTKLLGEGGFSYVYLVKEIADTTTGGSLNTTGHNDTRGGGGDASTKASGGRSNAKSGGGSNGGSSKRSGSLGKAQAEQQQSEKVHMVLKVTSILSRQQRDIAEKEAKLLSRLSHPSIIKMYDTCYRTVSASSGGGGFRKSSANDDSSKAKDRPQHLILMEFCEGGHALDVCNNLANKGEHFDLSTLIIAFGQICNAVSYLHAQRPPIVHRDLKPANFLVKNGAYKLCDFGSAVFGHVDLKTSEARNEAEEVIQKTTTQMFRAPEMVDLYMAKKLTQATDVWALGACLYSLAFLQNCFEEGSNLAILSRKYKIPDDNPYGDGLVELLDRMLTVDSKARADMTEVILCLSAVYSGRPLPPRKERSSKSKDKEKEDGTAAADAAAAGAPGGGAATTGDAAGGGSNSKRGERSKHKKSSSKNSGGERVGTFRTDGQGIYQENLAIDPNELKKSAAPAKKLDPNSAAARRRMAAAGAAAPSAATADSSAEEFASFHDRFDETAQTQGTVNEDLAFSTQAVDAFGDLNISKGSSDGQGGGGGGGGGQDIFASFDDDGADAGAPVGDDAFGSQAWGQSNDFSSFDAATNVDKTSAAAATASSGESGDEGDKDKDAAQRRRRSSSKGRTRRREGHERKKKDDDDQNGVGQEEGVEETLENMEEVMAANSEDGVSGEDGAKDRGASRTTTTTTAVRRGSRSTGRTSRRSATGATAATATAAGTADPPPARQKSISKRSSRRASEDGKS